MTRTIHWLIKTICALIVLLYVENIKANHVAHTSFDFFQEQEPTQQDSTKAIAVKLIDVKELVGKSRVAEGDTLDLNATTNNALLSIQQLLKGRVAGLHIQEKSGEPGTLQNMVLHGLSSPLFSNRDMAAVQPVVYINGIPLVTDNPFIYSTRQYDYNPLGPASNILAAVNIDNIESIEVVKDPIALAKLGPLAVNGAILINLKSAKSGYREVAIHSYVGMVVPENVSSTNAQYERLFRQQFYTKYNVSQQEAPFPEYLNDFSNANYFGSSQWADSYYQTAPVYNFNFSISSGSDRANFRFVAGRSADAGTADETTYSRNNAAFFLNMAPFTWLNFSSMVSGARTGRDGNKSLRDRYSEMEYLPSSFTPIAPNRAIYEDFLDEYSKTIDDKVNNIVRGYVALEFDLDKLYFSTKFSFDYNENIRDIFWPSTLLETVNFASNYFGYNQRTLWSGDLNYDFEVNSDHSFHVEALGSMQNDIHRYNYAKAYNGPNDFIKTPNWQYKNYRYTDQERMRLISTGVGINYGYKDIFKVAGLLKVDGSSNVQKDSRWLFTPSFSAEWNIKNNFLVDSEQVNDLNVKLSWARIGKLITSDRIAAGPQYGVELGWDQPVLVPSYNGLAGLSRPYTSGWIGYNMGWPYADKINLNLEGSFFNNKLTASLGIYNSDDKDMIIPVPVPREYGYNQEYKSGMEINNKGIDLTVSGRVLSLNNEDFTWDTQVTLNYNQNTLKALPNGLDELVIDDRKLKVGESIDRFWVYENKGIYENANDVPITANGSPLSYNSIPFQAGDPMWSDVNGDLVVNSADKVLKGHAMPPVTGGFYNQFKYKKWDLSFHIFFAMGHDALNSRASQRYSFAKYEGGNTIESISEINFWQDDVSTDYPLYNPWSTVDPYRVDQDLFLERLSYAKLRAVTLGYNFIFHKANTKSKTAYVYVSGTNLLTVTNFKGLDPELVEFNGYYTGYALPIPRAITVGMKLNL